MDVEIAGEQPWWMWKYKAALFLTSKGSHNFGHVYIPAFVRSPYVKGMIFQSPVNLQVLIKLLIKTLQIFSWWEEG